MDLLVGAGCSDDFKDGAGSPEDTGRPGGLAYDDDGDGFADREALFGHQQNFLEKTDLHQFCTWLVYQDL